MLGWNTGAPWCVKRATTTVVAVEGSGVREWRGQAWQQVETVKGSGRSGATYGLTVSCRCPAAGFGSYPPRHWTKILRRHPATRQAHDQLEDQRRDRTGLGCHSSSSSS